MQRNCFIGYTAAILMMSMATACDDGNGSTSTSDSGVASDDSQPGDGNDGNSASPTDSGAASDDSEPGDGNGGNSASTTDSGATSDGNQPGGTSDSDGSNSSSGTTVCTEDDACRTTDDCPPGQGCVECQCEGNPVVCNEWGPGEFGACLEKEEACGVAEGEDVDFGCVVDTPSNALYGICYFPGCSDTCDCPQPPAGFEAQVTCGSLVNPRGDCYISCADGLECPDGMGCVNDRWCAHIGSYAVDHGPYGDCANDPGFCPETQSGAPGLCLQPRDDQGTVQWGYCTTEGCASDDDCAAAPTGDAVATCADVTGDGTPNCHLSCAGGETCPDEMICLPEFQMCVFEKDFLEDYGNCEAVFGTEDSASCPGPGGGGACLSDSERTVSFCSSYCSDKEGWECPPHPSGTGDAPAICVETILGRTGCVLDCSAGQTCPDGMVCFADRCANPVP